jgi:hypothetical protein
MSRWPPQLWMQFSGFWWQRSRHIFAHFAPAFTEGEHGSSAQIVQDLTSEHLCRTMCATTKSNHYSSNLFNVFLTDRNSLRYRVCLTSLAGISYSIADQRHSLCASFLEKYRKWPQFCIEMSLLKTTQQTRKLCHCYSIYASSAFENVSHGSKSTLCYSSLTTLGTKQSSYIQ